MLIEILDGGALCFAMTIATAEVVALLAAADDAAIGQHARL